MVLSIDESDLKRGLQELNPEIHFDMGAAHNIWHPRQGEAQGVFYRGELICGMGRGQIPEWNRYAMVKNPDGTDRRSHVLTPGWRGIFNKIAGKKIPGVTWQTIADKFGIGYIGPSHGRYEVA